MSRQQRLDAAQDAWAEWARTADTDEPPPELTAKFALPDSYFREVLRRREAERRSRPVGYHKVQMAYAVADTHDGPLLAHTAAMPRPSTMCWRDDDPNDQGPLRDWLAPYGQYASVLFEPEEHHVDIGLLPAGWEPDDEHLVVALDDDTVIIVDFAARSSFTLHREDDLIAMIAAMPGTGPLPPTVDQCLVAADAFDTGEPAAIDAITEYAHTTGRAVTSVKPPRSK